MKSKKNKTAVLNLVIGYGDGTRKEVWLVRDGHYVMWFARWLEGVFGLMAAQRMLEEEGYQVYVLEDKYVKK